MRMFQDKIGRTVEVYIDDRKFSILSISRECSMCSNSISYVLMPRNALSG